jgi:phage shock protein PspC (stress-responsive transcriptional regulator)
MPTAAPPPADSETETDPGAPTPPPVTPTEPRFFTWIRSLGLARRNGWLGGVCVAIADRTRLDPILVRGIVVVLAVLGAPVVLVYAAAWFLLPDATGAIHALKLARGRVEGAVVAIAALVVASFLPLTQGFWWVGAQYWGDPDLGGSVGRVLWTLVVVAVGIVVVVWLARRAQHPDITTVPATTDDRPDTVPRPMEAAGDASTTVAAAVSTTAPEAEALAPEPSAPVAPPPGASDAELAAWREQQRIWQQQRAAWAAEQRREQRARRAAALAASSQEYQARLAERRRREPPAGAAVIGIVVGLALIGGAGAGIVASLAAPSGAVGWTAGLAAAAIVLGLGMAVAGLARRRAGGLAALAILCLVAAVATVPLAADRQVIPWVGGYGLPSWYSGKYARLAGETEINVATGIKRPADTVVDLWQRTGDVAVNVPPGHSVRIIATLHDGDLISQTIDPDTRERTPGEIYPATTEADGAHRSDIVFGGGRPDLTIRVELLSGSMTIATDPALEPEYTPSPAATPTPTPVPTEGVTP